MDFLFTLWDHFLEFIAFFMPDIKYSLEKYPIYQHEKFTDIGGKIGQARESNL